MSIFTSTYTNKVDSKGRVSVPAPFRSTLPEGKDQCVVLFPSLVRKALEGFDHGYLEQISSKLDNYAMFLERSPDPASKILAKCITLSFDAEGRMVLPKALMDHAAITDKVTFVGQGATFQIWSPDGYEAEMAQEEGIF